MIGPTFCLGYQSDAGEFQRKAISAPVRHVGVLKHNVDLAAVMDSRNFMTCSGDAAIPATMLSTYYRSMAEI
jgi:hypothetical protein